MFCVNILAIILVYTGNHADSRCFSRTISREQVKISIDLNDCEMLDAEEIYDESDESGPAEPRPMFTIQVSLSHLCAQKDVSGFLCSFGCTCAFAELRMPFFCFLSFSMQLALNARYLTYSRYVSEGRGTDGCT